MHPSVRRCGRDLARAMLMSTAVALLTLMGCSGRGAGGSVGGVTYLKSYATADEHLRFTASAAAADGSSITVSELTVSELDRPDNRLQGTTGITVTRTDADGNVLWSGVYGERPPPPLGLWRIVDATAAGDGGFFVAGEGPEGASVVKLSASGSREWLRTYRTGDPRNHRRIRRIAPAENGGFLLAGTSIVGDRAEGWLAIADASGSTRHTALIPVPDAPRDGVEVHQARQAPDGSYVFILADFGSAGANHYQVGSARVGSIDATLAAVRYLQELPRPSSDYAVDVVRLSPTGFVPEDFLLQGSSAYAVGPPGLGPVELDTGARERDGCGEVDVYHQSLAPDPTPGHPRDVVVVGFSVYAAGPCALEYSDRNRRSGRLEFFRNTAHLTFDAPGILRIADVLPEFNSELFAVAISNDSQYMVAGRIGNRAIGMPWTPWVAKFSRARELLWSRTYDPSRECSDWPVRLIRAGEGYLLSSENCLWRLDGAGNALWRIVNDAPERVIVQRSSVVATQDGGALVAAPRYRWELEDPGGPVTLKATGTAWLLRLGPDGAVAWQRELNPAPQPHAVLEIPGGFLLAGGTGTASWVAKLDAAGDVAWRTDYAAAGLDAALGIRSLHAREAGGYLLGNEGATLAIDDSGAVQWAWRHDLELGQVISLPDGDLAGIVAADRVVRFAANGAARWGYRLAPDPTSKLRDLKFTALQPMPDGGLVVTGNALATDQQHCDEAGGCRDVVLLSLAADGSVRWAKRYGTAGDETAVSLRVMADNGLLVAGESDGFTPGRLTGLMIRTDADGNVASQCPTGVGKPFSLTSEAFQPQFAALAITASDVPVTASDTGSEPRPHEIVVGSTCTGVSRSPVLSIAVSGSGAVVSDPPGIDCGAACQQAYTTGTRVTLTATPTRGATFTGWSGDCASFGAASTITVPVDNDMSCAAAFAGGPPSPAFVFSPNPAIVSRPVSFDGSGSTDDGTIVRYEWDFDGNGVFDAEGPTARFTYAATGTYAARLRVTDNDGNAAEVARELPVSAPGFRLSAEPAAISVQQGGTGSIQVRIDRNAGFTGVPVTLGVAEAPAGIAVTFGSNPSTEDAVDASITAALGVAVGTYTVSLNAFGTPPGGTGFGGRTSLTVNVTGLTPPPPPPAGDFSIAPRIGSVTVPQGEITAVDIDISRTLGFSELVSFTASQVPRGAHARFDPPGPTGGNTKRLILLTGPTADVGDSVMRVTATATGGLTRSAELSVQITPGAGVCDNQASAGADAFISPSIGNGAGGASPVLRVGTGLFEQGTKSYLAFDLRTTDARFDKAELVISLYANPWAARDPDSSRTVAAWGITDNDDWQPATLPESGIGWHNAPKNDTTSQYRFLGEGTTRADATRALGSFAVFSAHQTRRRYRIDVSEYLRWALGADSGYSTLAAQDTDGVVTFLLGNNMLFGGSSNDNFTEFFSREAPNPCDQPHLEIFR